MERRSALKKLALAATMLAAGVSPYAISQLMYPGAAYAKHNRLRPPGALKNEADFIAACIGCGLCGEVCPPHCIQFHKRDGGVSQNTPYIDPTNKACILCDKCMEVCPTNALNVMERAAIDMGIAFIDESACYPWVDRGICGACVSICPLGDKAISFIMWNQYRPVIKDGCVGCGLCVEVCPHPSLPIWVMDRPSEKARSAKALS